MSVSHRFKTLPPFVKLVQNSAYLTLTLVSLIIREPIKRKLDTYNCRIIWWGESECSNFRHSITYKIVNEVFSKYLRYCEVLELTITRENNDIGSAFIYNPSEIIEKPRIQLPVVDHGGNNIGELVLDIMFNYPIDKLKIIPHSPVCRFMSILDNGNVQQDISNYFPRPYLLINRHLIKERRVKDTPPFW